MFFWHVGATLWLFRWIFRDPKVDIRFLLLGAVLGDLIDLPVGTLILADRYSTGELWFHSLILPTIYLVTVLVLTRRGRRRRAWMALGIGWLLHLLLDGMWVSQEVFHSPSSGSISPERRVLAGLERALSIIGDGCRHLGGYLVWLWFA
jgi:hypothetical protein